MRRRVEVDGLGLDVLDLAGDEDRPALVLLHEGLGSIDLWRGLPDRLHAETGRRTIAYSRFDHGRSEPRGAPRGPRFFHDEALAVLPELLTALGVVRPVVVGHSDGASIALVHAASHEVTRVVLIAPHVVVEELALAAIRELRAQFLTGGLRERLARHHDDVDAAFWGWCDFWLDTGNHALSLEPEAAELQAPTLLIQGTDDAYGTLDQLDRIERAATVQAQRLVLPCGHSPHLEAPDDVVPAVVAFVDALP